MSLDKKNHFWKAVSSILFVFSRIFSVQESKRDINVSCIEKDRRTIENEMFPYKGCIFFSS